jgi:hypothetical protein
MAYTLRAMPATKPLVTFDDAQDAERLVEGLESEGLAPTVLAVPVSSGAVHFEVHVPTGQRTTAEALISRLGFLEAPTDASAEKVLEPQRNSFMRRLGLLATLFELPPGLWDVLSSAAEAADAAYQQCTTIIVSNDAFNPTIQSIASAETFNSDLFTTLLGSLPITIALSLIPCVLFAAIAGRRRAVGFKLQWYHAAAAVLWLGLIGLVIEAAEKQKIEKFYETHRCQELREGA